MIVFCSATLDRVRMALGGKGNDTMTMADISAKRVYDLVNPTSSFVKDLPEFSRIAVVSHCL